MSLPSTPSAANTAAARAPDPAALTGALVLQELGCEAPRDRAARRRGYDLLAGLRALQHALLADSQNSAALAHLTMLTTEVPEAVDPRLREAVTALVLRARVELARHDL